MTRRRQTRTTESIPSPALAPSQRHATLRHTLESRRLALIGSLRQRLRTIRDERAVSHGEGLQDDSEVLDIDAQEETEVALIELCRESVRQIDQALRRLEAGHYGICASCGDEIAEARLKAQPFAIRCLSCETAHERAHASPRRPRWELTFSGAPLQD